MKSPIKSPEREELRRRLSEKYGKPVFFVSELIYCPMYKTMVPDFIVEKKVNDGISAHKYIQEDFKKKRPGHVIEAERELILVRNGYVLVGHADIVDHTDLMVYEIKPGHLGDERYIYQLSAYVAMMRELTGKEYYGAFIPYTIRRTNKNIKITYGIVRPFYIVTYILKLLDKVAEIMARSEKQITIGGSWCRKCVWNGECRPRVMYRHNHGFVEVVTGE